MESLKALEMLKHTTNLYMPNELNGYKEELDIIQQDLEILEILKSFLFFVPSFYENQANWGNEYISMSYLDKTWTRPEIYEKVKQWCFENEIRGTKENK